MQEGAAGLEDAAKRAAGGKRPGALDAGEEGKLRGHADEAAEFLGLVADAAGGGEINAEGFFREEVFPGAEDVEVDFLVQVVRDGGVDDIDVIACQQFLVAGDERLDRGDLAKPVEQAGLEVADGDELGLHRKIHEGEPAGEGAGGFAAHEAAADDADADGSG